MRTIQTTGIREACMRSLGGLLCNVHGGHWPSLAPRCNWSSNAFAVALEAANEQLRETLNEIGGLPSFNTPSAGECIPRNATLRILRDLLTASRTVESNYHEHVAGDRHSHSFNGPHSHGGVSALIEAQKGTTESADGIGLIPWVPTRAHDTDYPHWRNAWTPECPACRAGVDPITEQP